MRHIPKDAPFSDTQRSWLGGFIAGLNSQRLATAQMSHAEAGAALATMNVLYGTQTGNSEELANNAAVLASERGFQPKLKELDSVDISTRNAKLQFQDWPCRCPKMRQDREKRLTSEKHI